MPKIKIARKSTLVDMTPMCDVAFLLLTFFMLTTKFKAEDPVEVVTPASISATLLPESHVALITISKDGRVFFGLDDQNQRYQLIKDLNQQYNLGLTDKEFQNYALASSVGMPINKLKQLLELKPSDQQSVQQEGIPVDSAHEELSAWIDYTKHVNASDPRLQFVVKADNTTKYEKVDQVLDILKKRNLNKLNLITSMKAIPPGTPAYETEQRSGGSTQESE